MSCFPVCSLKTGEGNDQMKIAKLALATAFMAGSIAAASAGRRWWWWQWRRKFTGRDHRSGRVQHSQRCESRRDPE